MRRIGLSFSGVSYLSHAMSRVRSCLYLAVSRQPFPYCHGADRQQRLCQSGMDLT